MEDLKMETMEFDDRPLASQSWGLLLHQTKMTNGYSFFHTAVFTNSDGKKAAVNERPPISSKYDTPLDNNAGLNVHHGVDRNIYGLPSQESWNGIKSSMRLYLKPSSP